MVTRAAAIPLSPRFERVLAFDGPTFGRPRPSPDELAALLAILAEGPPAAGRLNLGRAIFIAADNAPDAQTARLIAAILHDPAASTSLRCRAAAALGHIPTPDASRALTQALAGSPAELETILLMALARNGDDTAAAAIGAMPAVPAMHLTTLRRFARATIAYRTGAPLEREVEAALLPPVETAPGTGATRLATVAVPVTPLAPDVAARALAGRRGSTYGVQPSDAWVSSFECGGLRHLVLLAANLPRRGLAEAFGARRRIAGLLVSPVEPGAADAVVRRLIVTRPERGQVAVGVVDAAGRLMLSGTLKPQLQALAVSLRSHPGMGRATAAQGTLDASGLTLDARVAADGASLKRVAEADPGAR